MTEPGVGDPTAEAALERTLADALAEVPAPVEDDPFEVTNPGIANLPVPEALVTQAMPPLDPPVAGSVSASAPLVAPDPDDFDEGTAAEWNPRWTERLKAATPPVEVAPQPMSAPEPPMEPRVASGAALRWVLPGLGAIALLAALIIALPRRTGGGAPTTKAKPIPKAIPQSLVPYVQRAEAGDVAAMRQLGLSYAYGLGVTPDRDECLKWLRRAAKAGSRPALQELQALGATLDTPN